MLEQKRRGDIRMRHVAAIGAQQQTIHRLAAKPAPFRVRERHKPVEPERLRPPARIHPVGGEPRDLRRTHAHGQHQPHPLRGDCFEGEPVVAIRSFRRRRIRDARPRQRPAIRLRPRAQGRELRAVGLPPIAPERGLRVARVFAVRFFPRRRLHQQVERILRKRGHRLAVEVTAGVDVHLVDQQLVPSRGRRHLERGDKRKVGDRAVPRDEEDQVAPGRHLPGDAFEVVARAVHEVKTGRGQRLAVVDHGVYRRTRIFFVHGAEGLERDVVESAEFVARRGIGLGAEPVPAEPRAEPRNAPEQRPRRRQVAHGFHDIGLAAGHFVGLAQHADPAVAHQLVHHRPGERIARHARKRIRAAALKRHPQRAQRLRRAPLRRHRRQPPAHQCLALGQRRREPATDAEKRVRHIAERVAVRGHKRLQPGVGDRLAARIHREHRAHIRVHHEPRERPQDFGRVVRLARAAALGVRDGHDAVERRKHPRHHLQPRRELPRKTRRARRRAEDDHGVARAHAARPRPAITGKGARHRRRLHRRAGPESRLVQLKRLEMVREIRPRRQRERQPPHRQRFEHRGVAHVVARRDRRERMAEGQPPREQRLARRDGPDGEAMTFEDVLRERARRPVELDHRPRLQGSHRDRDIVPGGGQATDIVQRKSLGHTPTTMRTAPAASRRNRNQAPGRTFDAQL